MAHDVDSMSQQEQAERDRQRRITDKNYEILEDLERRDIKISSNRYDHEDREYYVQKVEKTYLDGATGYIPSVRLINESVRPSLQPVLKVPRNLIPIDKEGDRRTLNLIYTSKPSVDQSFHFMNRYERPDLEIYITYEV